MKENDFVRLLLKNLIGVFHRNHGSRYGTGGLPDIEGTHLGKSVIIEAKTGHLSRDDWVILDSPLTVLQKAWLFRYQREDAIALVAVYLNDWKEIVFFETTAYIPEKVSKKIALGLLMINPQLTRMLFREEFLTKKIREAKKSS